MDGSYPAAGKAEPIEKNEETIVTNPDTWCVFHYFMNKLIST